MKQAIAYYRRSTDNRQTHSIERQALIVETFVDTNELEILKRFVETASGKDAQRPQLEAAILYARKHKVPICVSSVSRLSRDVSFGSALLQDKTVQYIVCDMGMTADSFMLNILLCVAQKEREMISQRTKDALAVVRRYKKLGNPRWHEKHVLPAAWEANKRRGADTVSKYLPVINLIKLSGVTSYNGIARQMTGMGFTSPRGNPISAAFVRKCILR